MVVRFRKPIVRATELLPYGLGVADRLVPSPATPPVGPPVSGGSGNKRERIVSRQRVLDGRTTKIIYDFLLERDGPNCQLCKKPPNQVQGMRLQINHKDGNKKNNKPWNLELTHGTCNREHFLKGLKLREKERETENISYEARRSLELSPTLELELNRLLAESKVGLTVREAQNRLAKICGCDQQTVGRCLDRECTAEGLYALSDRTVSDGRRKRTLQFISRRRKKDPDEPAAPVQVIKP